ncbi:MAG TPA: hypothetical protein VE643_08895 [Nitrososphaeraceae archaeon]|nr:hypothetical protein [Nitrososphaeraceae archaeon]
MKTKRKPLSGVRGADDSELSEKALERTNSGRYRAVVKSSKCIGDDSNDDTENRNYYNNNNNNHDKHNGSNINDDDDDDNNNNNNDNIIPLEIDTHFQMYGKHMWDVQYGERCPLCNKRIDEYGFCACGSGGE